MVLNLAIVYALEPILLYDIKQLLLELYNLANHLTVKLEYFILLILTFTDIGHSVGNVNIDLILHLVLKLR